MPEFNDGFLGLPARPGKPREVGITHVMDKGLNLRDIEGLFDTGGQFVDIVKFGWGTSYVTNNLSGSPSTGSRTWRSPTAPSRSRASGSSS